MREGAVVVADVRQTCEACPSQWEGRTDGGLYVYARFRFGELTVGIGPTIDDAVLARCGRGDGRLVFQRRHGHPLDGYLSRRSLTRLTRHHVRWPWSRRPTTPTPPRAGGPEAGDHA